MFSFFRSMVDRFKNLFVTQAALDLEAEFLTHAAERRAELHRRARKYDEEGLSGIAHYLRRQADEISSERPLAGILAATAHLQGEALKPVLPLPPSTITDQTPKAYLPNPLTAGIGTSEPTRVPAPRHPSHSKRSGRK